MKLLEPENSNYAAQVVEIKSLTDLAGCDNVVGTPLLGFQAIVGKDTEQGDLGIVFTAETQLSEEYARKNNLHRHGNLNDNEGSKGYLEDNRRVRAMKFRGHRSDALFMPLESLSYIKNLDITQFKVGDTFDKIGDSEICKKYVLPRTRREQRIEKNKEKFVRVDKKFLPEHYDTDNYFRNTEVISTGRWVTITQKLHGTSIRIGNTVVARKLSWRDKVAKRAGVKVADTEMDYVFGSRKVIKDINNPNQNHFYNSDIWTEEGAKLSGSLPENFLVYGELVGWTKEGAPLQKNYTYQVPNRTCDLYVYRVAFVNNQGIVTDLSWEQTKEFCHDRGLNTVPELYSGPMPTEEEIVSEYIDKRFHEEGYAGAVPLDKESPVDEGICIRVDMLAPYILKAKGEKFYAHESAMIDEEAEDLEVEGSTTE